MLLRFRVTSELIDYFDTLQSIPQKSWDNGYRYFMCLTQFIWEV